MRTLYASTDQALVEQIRAVWSDGHIEPCDGGRAALAALDLGGYDAVVTDLRLTDSNAIDLVRQIRARGLSLPVVVVGDDEARLRYPALDAGADDYLVRTPTLARTVSAAVRAAVDRRRLEATMAPATLRPVRAQFAEASAVRGVPWMQELVALTRKAAQSDLAAQAFADLEAMLAPASAAVDLSNVLDQARALVTGFNAVRRRAVAVTDRAIVDDEVSRMSPTLIGLTQGLAELRLELGSERGRVLLSPEEVLRLVTLLVTSCREALPAGGTVSLETRLTEMAPPIGRSATRIPAVDIEVTRVGLAALPVMMPPTLASLASTCAFLWEPITLAGSIVGVRVLLPISGDEAMSSR